SGGTPGTVNTNFFYSAGHGNAGFNYTANLELGQHTGVWNVIQTGIVPAGSYQVATTVSTLANNTEASLVLGNLFSILASGDPVSVNYFTGIKQNGKHLINWKLTCNNSPAVTITLERSNNAVNYTAIFTEQATALRCQQPFIYTDDRPVAGVNYYRIKLTDADGKVFYSTIVTLINTIEGINVDHIAPNPVTANSFHVSINAAKAQQAALIIADIQGRIIQKSGVSLSAGFNSIPVNAAQLTKGSYQLYLMITDGETKALRFVLQ
ncbi:MAG: T9SS type A sorting domain-containing protein, partial [Ferruginibacter sp.]